MSSTLLWLLFRNISFSIWLENNFRMRLCMIIHAKYVALIDEINKMLLKSHLKWLLHFTLVESSARKYSNFTTGTTLSLSYRCYIKSTIICIIMDILKIKLFVNVVSFLKLYLIALQQIHSKLSRVKRNPPVVFCVWLSIRDITVLVFNTSYSTQSSVSNGNLFVFIITETPL
jgi:hypothetical protein